MREPPTFRLRRLHRQHRKRRDRTVVYNLEDIAEHLGVKESEVEEKLQALNHPFHRDSSGKIFTSIPPPESPA